MEKFIRIVKVTHDANEVLRIPCVSQCRKEIPTDENSHFLYWIEPQLNQSFAPGYVTENTYLCELPDHTWLPMTENDYLNNKSV